MKLKETQTIPKLVSEFTKISQTLNRPAATAAMCKGFQIIKWYMKLIVV